MQILPPHDRSLNKELVTYEGAELSPERFRKLIEIAKYICRKKGLPGEAAPLTYLHNRNVHIGRRCICLYSVPERRPETAFEVNQVESPSGPHRRRSDNLSVEDFGCDVFLGIRSKIEERANAIPLVFFPAMYEEITPVFIRSLLAR